MIGIQGESLTTYIYVVQWFPLYWLMPMAEPIEANLASSCCKKGLLASLPTPRKSLVRPRSTSLELAWNFPAICWACLGFDGTIRKWSMLFLAVSTNGVEFISPISSPSPMVEEGDVELMSWFMLSDWFDCLIRNLWTWLLLLPWG